MQGGTCGTESCDGRGLVFSAWPIRVGWVAGSGWMPIWLTNADQLRSAHGEPGSQSNQPQSARVTCGSSVKSVFWIWSLRPGYSKVSWDLWNRTIYSRKSRLDAGGFTEESGALLGRSAADGVTATRTHASQAVSVSCHCNQNFCPPYGSDTRLQIRRAPRSAATWVDVILSL